MSLILPYYENLGAKDGAFITPDGKILSVDGDRHEEFAESYCNGRDYAILTGEAFGPPAPSNVNALLPQTDETHKHVNVFQTSQLTKGQLERYKVWLARHKMDETSIYSDFLVYFLFFDKVEKKLSNVITTAAYDPHVRFFNYYLMNWRIDYKNHLVYDEKSDSFHVEKIPYAASDYEDREAEEEIKEIKEKVLIKDRPYFFK